MKFSSEAMGWDFGGHRQISTIDNILDNIPGNAKFMDLIILLENLILL